MWITLGLWKSSGLPTTHGWKPLFENTVYRELAPPAACVTLPTRRFKSEPARDNPVICDACGQNYDAAHNCPAVITSSSEERTSSDGFAPIYYLRLAFKIAFWDELSIRRASRDPRATPYGLALWLIVALAVWFITVLPDLLKRIHAVAPQLIATRVTAILALAMIFALLAMSLNTFIQVGVCHLIAKRFFGAKGSLMSVMRPSLLGSIVGFLELIPRVGDWAFAIAWTAVLIVVFEKIDRIGRKEALTICVGINVVSHLLLGLLGI
jgi:hypothetical protein